MKKKRTTKRPTKRVHSPQDVAEASARRGVPEEELQGPVAEETVVMLGDAERRAQEEALRYQSRIKLSGGDPDADWRRADHVGEEAVGGSVATPDQDIVDNLGEALGVPRAPDEEVRTSQEILEERDRNRWELEG
ncbi:MAG TPA: DUF6335 family protein [Candidatus Limnocylindria bacterium]|nr:DUF6335 family protein [Candidatus Limnocylindria bacterium]